MQCSFAFIKYEIPSSGGFFPLAPCFALAIAREAK